MRPNHSHRERGEFVRRELDSTEDLARRIVIPTLRRRCEVPIALTPFISKPMSTSGGVKRERAEKPEVLWTFQIRVVWLLCQCDTRLKRCHALRQSLGQNETKAERISIACARFVGHVSNVPSGVWARWKRAPRQESSSITFAVSSNRLVRANLPKACLGPVLAQEVASRLRRGRRLAST